MANYSTLDQDKIKVIARRYGLLVKDYGVINGGACNSSFLLKTDLGNFVLTIFDEQDTAYISIFCRILQHLDKNEFQTSKIISLENEEYVSEVFGKPMIMKTYLEGAVQKELDECMLDQIG